jgi:hypothetical protein
MSIRVSRYGMENSLFVGFSGDKFNFGDNQPPRICVP